MPGLSQLSGEQLFFLNFAQVFTQPSKNALKTSVTLSKNWIRGNTFLNSGLVRLDAARGPEEQAEDSGPCAGRV